MKLNVQEQGIVDALDCLTLECYGNSERHGFWQDYEAVLSLIDHFGPATTEMRGKYILDTKLHKIALIVSELGEAVEGVRKPCFDKHCTIFSSEAIELADTIIRIMDYCGKFGVPIAHAVVAKMRYNATRPHMHGKGA
jgi:hypothetical protein